MALKTTWSYGGYRTKITAASPEETWSYGQYQFFWELVSAGGLSIPIAMHLYRQMRRI